MPDPGDASEEKHHNNKLTIEILKAGRQLNTDCFFRLFALAEPITLFKGWGVGLARKTGMDEAVRRFDSINDPDGVILNLDADCLVDTNYFVSVYKEFFRKKRRSACSIYFEHPLMTGMIFLEVFINHITLYELHLRYYFQGLAYAQAFPMFFIQ